MIVADPGRMRKGMSQALLAAAAFLCAYQTSVIPATMLTMVLASAAVRSFLLGLTSESRTDLLRVVGIGVATFAGFKVNAAYRDTPSSVLMIGWIGALTLAVACASRWLSPNHRHVASGVLASGWFFLMMRAAKRAFDLDRPGERVAAMVIAFIAIVTLGAFARWLRNDIAVKSAEREA